MNETSQRMLDGSKEPNARQIAAWLGPVNYKRWKNILQFIETNYPGVFAPDSLRSQFGGLDQSGLITLPEAHEGQKT